MAGGGGEATLQSPGALAEPQGEPLGDSVGQEGELKKEGKELPV